MTFGNSNGFNGGNNNNFNGSNNGNNGEKKSFTIGRIYGSNGQIDIGIYISASATWVSMLGKQSTGTNPSSGTMSIENTRPDQLPSVLLSTETAKAFLDAVDVEDRGGVLRALNADKLNFTINAGGAQHATMQVVGSDSDVKITFKSDRGERTVSLTTIPVGPGRNAFASFENLYKHVLTGYNRAMRHKMDPNEFAAELAGGGASMEDTSNTPF